MTRFAVAARELEGAPRGVGRWLLEVLREIEALGRAPDIELVCERGLDPALGLGNFATRATGPGPGGGATAWEQVALPRALAAARPRALLGPAYSLPVRLRCPGVVALHDLSFEAHPEWFSLREGLRRRTLARLAARRARSILVLSQFGRDEVVERYGVAESRLRIVGAGVSSRFVPVTDPESLADARRALGLEGEIVLSVGSLFSRRRPTELIAAMREVLAGRPDAMLVLVGDDRTWPPLDLAGLLGRSGVASRTVWLERIDDRLLVALYSLARVAVYLSDYEGFGLPPVEAAACGTPVIASHRTALAEILDGHATLLDDLSPPAIAAAILARLATPAADRERPAWVEAHSWRRVAGGVLAALDEAAG